MVHGVGKFAGEVDTTRGKHSRKKSHTHKESHYSLYIER